MDTIAEVKRRFGVKTILGVSNISFGLPHRPLLNRTFLTMAIARGLDMAIINPNDLAMMDTIAACKLLCLQDAGGTRYISRFTAREAEEQSSDNVVKTTVSWPSPDTCRSNRRRRRWNGNFAENCVEEGIELSLGSRREINHGSRLSHRHRPTVALSHAIERVGRSGGRTDRNIIGRSRTDVYCQ